MPDVVIALAWALALVVAVDQGAKAMVLAGARAGRSSLAARIIRVRFVSGAGIVGRAPCSGLALVWALAVAASILSLEWGAFSRSELAASGLGLALGGAGSNLGDRVFRGGIVDFVDLRVWPVFNLADAAIVAGVAVALVAW